MIVIYILIGLGAGAVVGFLVRQQMAATKVGSAEARAEKLLDEAKNKEKELLLEAKGKALEIIEEAKKQEAEFRSQMVRFEERVDRKEKELENKSQNLDKQKQDLDLKHQEVKDLQEEIKQLKVKQLENLEKIAGLTREQAGKVLMDSAEKLIKEEMVELHKKLISEARESADKEARDLVTQALERVSSEVTAEVTTTVVQIPSEEMKGRIIGKEGRNIRSFEQMMGVEILIDDSPDSVVLSGFNSIRRHIAKLTLEKLLADGRIHPARIEEAYEKSKAEINEQIKQAGEQAVYELGITNFPPKLVHLVGRMLFRTSYGQNILRHSVEMAKIGAILAEELGADVKIVKQGALLHDIGKALDQDLAGSHVVLVVKIAEKFDLDPRINEAIASHHFDTDVSGTAKRATSIEAVIVDVCDNISGSRPGARKDSLENYIKRLTDLENIANNYEGVQKSYAIQGGRELRVFVIPEKIDDYSAQKMARDIANQIQNEIKFPGEIKVHVIRETRVIEYAR